MSDKNVTAVCERHIQRAAVGLSKYGVTTERGDLNDAEWLQHLQDELMDAAVYVERLKHDHMRAAAPDMYEALGLLLSFHESVGSPSPAGPCEMARAALARARGEA